MCSAETLIVLVMELRSAKHTYTKQKIFETLQPYWHSDLYTGCLSSAAYCTYNLKEGSVGNEALYSDAMRLWSCRLETAAAHAARSVRDHSKGTLRPPAGHC
jgi:hypothetical protein